jgi:hypothetical protein
MATLEILPIEPERRFNRRYATRRMGWQAVDLKSTATVSRSLRDQEFDLFTPDTVRIFPP